MDKATVESRLAMVEQQIVQTSATLNMLVGVKNECLHWISEFNKAAKNAAPSDNAEQPKLEVVENQANAV